MPRGSRGASVAERRLATRRHAAHGWRPEPGWCFVGSWDHSSSKRGLWRLCSGSRRRCWSTRSHSFELFGFIALLKASSKDRTACGPATKSSFENAARRAWRELAKQAAREVNWDSLGDSKPRNAKGLDRMSLPIKALQPAFRNHRRGRDSNPRYEFDPVRRFSKPLPSATRSPLLIHTRDPNCKSGASISKDRIDHSTPSSSRVKSNTGGEANLRPSTISGAMPPQGS